VLKDVSSFFKQLGQMNLERAIQIAVEAHKGQTDRVGVPYVAHVFSVMEKGKTTNEKIVGVLHDLVEDTHWTIEMLQNEGFSEEVVEAVRCITKITEDEDYDVYIARVKSSLLATRVKINDLQDNMNILRYDQITERDTKRLNKYLKIYKDLISFVGHS
jgi:(p)ppGpp synthase/HD superfamily hydrolase